MFNREKNDVKRVPMMPVRDMVIFPQMMTPFIVGREASVRALEEAMAGDKKIFLATQHDASVDDPKPTEIYQVGTLANIVQSVKLPDGNIRVLVEDRLPSAAETPLYGNSSRAYALTANLRLAEGSTRVTPVLTRLTDRSVVWSQPINVAATQGDVGTTDPAKLKELATAWRDWAARP